MKRFFIVFNVILIISLILTTTVVTAYTDALESPTSYKPGDLDDTSSTKVEDIISKVLSAVTNIGIAVAVITLAVIGIKYMFGSAEERADYKKTMAPYLIGASLLLGILTVVEILIAIGEKINS